MELEEIKEFLDITTTNHDLFLELCLDYIYKILEDYITIDYSDYKIDVNGNYDPLGTTAPIPVDIKFSILVWIQRIYQDKKGQFTGQSEYGDGKIFDYVAGCMPKLTKDNIARNKPEWFC